MQVMLYPMETIGQVCRMFGNLMSFHSWKPIVYPPVTSTALSFGGQSPEATQYNSKLLDLFDAARNNRSSSVAIAAFSEALFKDPVLMERFRSVLAEHSFQERDHAPTSQSPISFGKQRASPIFADFLWTSMKMRCGHIP